ncbi:ribonuclease P protein component 1 [Halohasta salina]|uniref:ribonuclease P protein component 1 n=1 Tax=Halohasta salina TaxID=2961621 RepID=UPI0020A5B038|nr:ribonuclease P protein component 1 [Halohasta salina]
MPRTPETLTRHELIGLPLRVVDAASADFVGLSGRVVSETMHTLVVSTASGEKRVPKADSVFEFALSEESTDDQGAGVHTDEAAEIAAGDHPAADPSPGRGRKGSGSPFELGEETAGVRPRKSSPSECSANQPGGCEGGVYVTVDGSRLLSRPADRTQRTGDSKWR